MKLIVFDWDGTLVDSVGRIIACTQWTCRDLGFSPPTDEAVKDAIGLDLMNFMAATVPQADEGEKAELVEGYRNRWRSGELAESELFPGIRDLLASLASGGYLLAVATGKSRAGLNRELDVHSLVDFFHTSRCPDESKPKPHPLMLHQIMDELSVQAEETLMVGDTELDMDMAHRAGVARFAVTSGCHDESRLSRWKPISCASDATHIWAWLNGYQDSKVGFIEK